MYLKRSEHNNESAAFGDLHYLSAWCLGMARRDRWPPCTSSAVSTTTSQQPSVTCTTYLGMARRDRWPPCTSSAVITTTSPPPLVTCTTYLRGAWGWPDEIVGPHVPQAQ